MSASPPALACVRLGSLSLPPSFPPTSQSIMICLAQQLIPSGSKVLTFGYHHFSS